MTFSKKHKDGFVVYVYSYTVRFNKHAVEGTKLEGWPFKSICFCHKLAQFPIYSNELNTCNALINLLRAYFAQK